MQPDTLRERQKPLKEKYAANPESARIPMVASGVVDQSTLSCQIRDPAAKLSGWVAGLHPAAGGSGDQACSGDLLLESLVACAGVTLAAVATAMGLELTAAEVRCEGILDFRGTLAVEREVPVGFQSIETCFQVCSPATDEQLTKLFELTDRYCVVQQTLAGSTHLETCWMRQ